jgi:hypothetical protein
MPDTLESASSEPSFAESLKDRDDRAKIAKRDRKVGDFQTEEIKLRNEESTALRQLSAKDGSLEADSNVSGIYELCGTSKGSLLFGSRRPCGLV